MPHFWDCNIVGDLNNLGAGIDLIAECIELGYYGVVLNYVVADINNTQLQEALHTFIDNDYGKFVQYFAGKINIRSRLTLNLTKTKKHCSMEDVMNINKNKELFDKFDIIAVKIGNRFHQNWSLESLIQSAQFDIINLDEADLNNKRHSTLFKQLIRKCCKKESRTYFEITLMSFKTNMKNIIRTVNFIGSVIGKINKNFILSTAASKQLQCRTAKDLLNITNLFDSKFQSNKINQCISSNIEDVLESAKINRIAFRKCIQSEPEGNKQIILPIESSSNDSNDKDIKHQTKSVHINNSNNSNKSNTLHSNVGKKKWKTKATVKKGKTKPFKR